MQYPEFPNENLSQQTSEFIQLRQKSKSKDSIKKYHFQNFIQYSRYSKPISTH